MELTFRKGIIPFWPLLFLTLAVSFILTIMISAAPTPVLETGVQCQWAGLESLREGYGLNVQCGNKTSPMTDKPSLEAFMANKKPICDVYERSFVCRYGEN